MYKILILNNICFSFGGGLLERYLFGLFRVFESDKELEDYLANNPNKRFIFKVKKSDGRQEWSATNKRLEDWKNK